MLKYKLMKQGMHISLLDPIMFISFIHGRYAVVFLFCLIEFTNTFFDVTIGMVHDQQLNHEQKNGKRKMLVTFGKFSRVIVVFLHSFFAFILYCFLPIRIEKKNIVLSQNSCIHIITL